MKIRGVIFFLLAILMIAGCRSSHIILAYKNPNRPRQEYKRIVVAGIVKSENDSLRIQIEKWFADDLKKLGYNAVSATDEFGPGNFGVEGQAETYRKLCGKGIDAVITIALVDKSKEKNSQPRKVYGYPNNYYYDRVWNYKNILANLSDESNQNNSGYFWESIFFDLSTLEAQCTVQTRSFNVMDEKKISRDFENQIIYKMVRQKILTRNLKGNNLKPF
jgi:hypothetical protein